MCKLKRYRIQIRPTGKRSGLCSWKETIDRVEGSKCVFVELGFSVGAEE